MDEGVRLSGAQEVPVKSPPGSSSGDASLLLPSSLGWTLLLYAALVLATTAVIAFALLVVTAVITLLVNGVERRARAVQAQPAE